jgi:hypothetical protein
VIQPGMVALDRLGLPLGCVIAGSLHRLQDVNGELRRIVEIVILFTIETLACPACLAAL